MRLKVFKVPVSVIQLHIFFIKYFFNLCLGISEHEEDWKGFRFSGKISKICHRRLLKRLTGLFQVTLSLKKIARPDSQRYLKKLRLINISIHGF